MLLQCDVGERTVSLGQIVEYVTQEEGACTVYAVAVPIDTDNHAQLGLFAEAVSRQEIVRRYKIGDVRTLTGRMIRLEGYHDGAPNIRVIIQPARKSAIV